MPRAAVEVIIPTCGRPAALAITLTCLAAQSFEDFSVHVSDQTEGDEPLEDPCVQAVVRLLRARGRPVSLSKHLPRRGMAEHRHFLLEQVRAPYALSLDDDVLMEPDLLARMVRALEEERCGFVGSAVIGLSYQHDERPDEQHIELWHGPVQPERVTPRSPAWARHKLHNAANLLHVQRRLGLSAEQQRKYRVAWVGGCVLYDVDKLRSVGGFSFWPSLPPSHCGEDALAQLRVMARHGGCGLIPSGAYHLELPTTIPDRRVNAPDVLGLDPE